MGYWGCVLIGRWIGGLLGYKPFFREYTTDWDYAVAKMKGSFFQRHLVNDAFTAEKPWSRQVLLEPVTKPTNAEFEPWTVDMLPKPLDLGPVKEYKADKLHEKAFDGGMNGKATGVKPFGDHSVSTDRDGSVQGPRNRSETSGDGPPQ